jgi:nucleolysin TIA-1/TIAR
MTPQGPSATAGRPNALPGHGPQSPAGPSPGGRWQDGNAGFSPQAQGAYGQMPQGGMPPQGMPQSAGGYGRGNGPATPGGWGGNSAAAFGGNGFAGYQQ